MDAAPAMLALARRNATVLGRHNAWLVRALGEALPLVEVFGAAGFRLVEQRIAPGHGAPHIFSVFRRGP